MIKKIITLAILYAVHAANVIADDIEIYQGADVGVRPNIMFLLDTSGSMENTTEFAQGPYDPDTLYPGPFHVDRYYYREFSAADDWLNMDIDNTSFRNAMLGRYIHKDAFKCQSHEDSLEHFGRIKAKFLQWNPTANYKNGWSTTLANKRGIWTELTTTLDTTRYVECESDITGNRGGLTEGDGLYATHELNQQPYTTNSDDAIDSSEPYKGDWGCFLGVCSDATDSIFTGNYLNYDYYTGDSEVTYASRIYIMGAAIAEAVGTHAGLNVGLARFDGTAVGQVSFNFDGNPFTSPIELKAPDGGMVEIPMRSSTGAGDLFNTTIKDWDAWGKTPLSESYYEVASYLRGEAAPFGDTTRKFSRRDNRYYDMFSVPASKQGGIASNDYQSPISDSCQQNHIVVFSDGLPTYDTSANTPIKHLIATNPEPVPLPLSLANDCAAQGDVHPNDWLSLSRGHGECADDLAFYLANTDQVDDSRLIGNQYIRTWTIGGFLSNTTSAGQRAEQILTSMATHGKGNYFPIDSYDSFRAALANIMQNILTNPVSFTAPVVSVNAFNTLELSDELYYSVFKPHNALNWSGNIKKYRLGTDASGKISVMDSSQPPRDAIDPTTTYFSTNAKSFWSAEVDGPSVTQGGLASHMQAGRVILTSQNNSTALTPLSTAISKTQLNITDKDDSYHSNLIAWASGQDLKDIDGDEDFTEARVSMEDPLHSIPTIVNYYKDRETDTSERIMFIGTNSGYLHAVRLDDENPREAFSFIPKELLHNLDKYYSGGDLFETKAYGIDGPITHWHQDLNGNGNVDAADGEKVYVYITLRRGGQSIYALDVTNPAAPTLAWEKHGQYPASIPNRPTVSPGYENLGQTWAQLEPATVAWNNEQRVVLFTAGGYDPIEDGTDRNGPATRLDHNMGTTVYMIDAATGEVLWDAKSDLGSAASNMKNSFAANVAPIDSVGDGLANVIFATDTGGRIWRFDITKPVIDGGLPDDYATDAATFATGGAILDINGGSSASNRRFFNEVDVVYQRSIDSILLSVGSGYRSHPLTTATQDYHYLIKTSVNAPDAYTTINQSMLSPWGTENDFGWHIQLLEPGEKVLARSSTVGNNILLTTFAPNDPSTTIACDTDAGQTFLYTLSLEHDSGTISYTFNRQQMNQGGIPPSPVLISPLNYGQDASNPDLPSNASKRKNVLVGTEVVTDDSGRALEVGDPYDNITKDYWLERAQ